MSRCLLKYVSIIVTVLLRFVIIKIECCSLSTNDIINLINNKENYETDPCYIQWKVTQDAKLAGIRRKTNELDRSLHEYTEKRLMNEAIQRENRQKDFFTSTVNTNESYRKESGVWKLLGIFVGAIVGICCCAACIAALQSNDNVPAINRATNIPRSISPEQVRLTSVVSTYPLGNRPDLTNNANNNFSNLDPSSSSSSCQDSRVNVPSVLRRQNSLPSYDDAVRMAGDCSSNRIGYTVTN